MNAKLKAALAVSLFTVALAAVFQAPLRWSAKKFHREIFPEQIPERPVYDETAKSPVDLATFVRDARRAWPKAGVAMVHDATLDVATGLLMRSDIEVGSIVEGTFVPWSISPWKAAEKIRTEISGFPGYMSDEHRYVFRRKSA